MYWKQSKLFEGNDEHILNEQLGAGVTGDPEQGEWSYIIADIQLRMQQIIDGQEPTFGDLLSFDYNGDGTIDFGDLTIALSLWGAGRPPIDARGYQNSLAAGDDDLPGAPEIRLPGMPRKPRLPKRPTRMKEQVDEQVVDQGVDPRDVVRLLKGKVGITPHKPDRDQRGYPGLKRKLLRRNEDGSLVYTLPGYPGYTITIFPDGITLVMYRGELIARFTRYETSSEAKGRFRRFIDVVLGHNEARLKLFKNLTAKNIFDIKRDRSIMDNPGLDPYRNIDDIMKDRRAGNTP